MLKFVVDGIFFVVILFCLVMFLQFIKTFDDDMMEVQAEIQLLQGKVNRLESLIEGQ